MQQGALNMTDTFVGRHKGAAIWAKRRGINAAFKEHFEDADMAAIRPGDCVYGPLPIQIVAQINRRGGR
jgi:CRISPR-associated protein Csx16